MLALNRYRKWDLGNDIVLIARCEHDAVMYGPNNEVQFINVKSLNEWDSRVRAASFLLVTTNCLTFCTSGRTRILCNLFNNGSFSHA